MTGLANVKLHLVESIDDVLALNEWLGYRRPYHALGFDTETTGLIVGKDRVRLAQVGDGNHGWAIPWDGWWGLFEDVIKRWDGDLLAHNAKFDAGMLSHMGVDVRRGRVKDTRIAAHCMAPHYSTALKNVAGRLVDAKAGSLKDDLSSTAWTWETVPVTYGPYWTYGALDPVLAYKIWEILEPQVQADCPAAFELENEVSWIIERMERYGVHINREFAQRRFDEFTAHVEEIERWCWTHYRVKPGSNAEVVKLLEVDGVPFSKATKSGAVALDADVLGHIDHPLAQAVLSRRRYQKLASTYLRHFVEDLDGESLIHPTINVLGTRTSRMSMENPNLQNLPRKSTVNPAADAIRECADSRYGDDGLLLMCDFDQVEMRGMAWMAQEPSMIAAFADTTQDFFVSLAHMVYDDDTIVKADPRRQIVKNAGYATIYASGVEKFAITAGIPIEQAREVRSRWNKLFPKVAEFQQAVIRTGQQRRETEGVPYVRCPVTRRRQICDPGKEYALVNYLIQGAAAAIFKRKIIELDSAGLGQWLTVPVHDEIILDVPKEHAAEAAKILTEVMNDDNMIAPVRLSASVSAGKTWGAKEAYDLAVHSG